MDLFFVRGLMTALSVAVFFISFGTQYYSDVIGHYILHHPFGRDMVAFGDATLRIYVDALFSRYIEHFLGLLTHSPCVFVIWGISYTTTYLGLLSLYSSTYVRRQQYISCIRGKFFWLVMLYFRGAEVTDLWLAAIGPVLLLLAWDVSRETSLAAGVRLLLAWGVRLEGHADEHEESDEVVDEAIDIIEVVDNAYGITALVADIDGMTI